MGPIAKLGEWLDDRAGYRSVIKGALDEPVRGGASFAYVFGSVLTFILILQMTTGIFLAMYYSPSASDAWASVAYIQDQVTLGWFVRGLHSHGASAMVIIAGFHLMQTALYGAYKKPRELNWIIGVVMLGLILAFALTGYLLPWDQTGFWATKVATGIAGSTPFVGEFLQELIQGGNEYGNLTLTRFFAIHVFILPASILLLLVAHIGLFRRHGVTPKWGKSEDELDNKTQPFWPDQLFKDMVAIAVVFAVMVGVTMATGGASLDAPADPASNFDARPEWYFRPLFQLLKYFHGPAELVVALGLPVILGGILLGLPFADRGPDRDPRKRMAFLAVLFVLFAGAVALTGASFSEDAGDDNLQARLAEAEESGAEARTLAETYGVPPQGGTAVFSTEPAPVTPKTRYAATSEVAAATVHLWDEHCATCHERKAPAIHDGFGAWECATCHEREAPAIGVGYNSRDWIRGLLLDPDDDVYFGRTKIVKKKKRMKPTEFEGPELDAVVEFVYAETGADDADKELAAAGIELFDDNKCSDCHEREGDEESDPGPNLFGRGSAEYLVRFIANPGAPNFFGDNDDMPAFDDKLTELERRALAEYIIWLRTATP